MQEIAIILSSLAGVATAAAVRKIPRRTQLLSLGASSHIKNQIRTLNIEKEILTKTISRLYQADSEFSKIQRDKLLVKYQHQLGIILAKLEKMEQSSQHPDLGPVGDGLITLMDQKLSRLDDRLYELSSKISTADILAPKNEDKFEKVSEERTEIKNNKKVFNFEKQKQPQESIIIPPSRQRQSFELTTLTRLSKKEPKFPLLEKQTAKETIQQKPVVQEIESKDEPINKIVQPKPKTIDVLTDLSKSDVKIDSKLDISKEVARITEHKALPEPKKPKPIVIDDDFDDDNDSDDLDKIKGEIMNVLSKLDQAEVE